MTTTTRPDFVLSHAEFDLVPAALGLGRVPFPLQVPSLGTTMGERSALVAEAFGALSARGLASGDQLDARLEDLLRLLFAPTVSVDAVGHIEQPMRALAAAHGNTGVLAQLGADELWLTEIRPTSLALSIVGLLPPNVPGPVRALSMPSEPLYRMVGSEEADEDDDPFGGDLDDHTALIRSGLSSRDASTLIELVNNRCGGGQFGVSRGLTRASTLVTWFDTHQGRYLMTSEKSWLSITPADNQRIEHRLATAVSTVV